MEIENLCKDIRARAFERKEGKTPEQVGASWYNDDLTYDGVSKTLFIILLEKEYLQKESRMKKYMKITSLKMENGWWMKNTV